MLYLPGDHPIALSRPVGSLTWDQVITFATVILIAIGLLLTHTRLLPDSGQGPIQDVLQFMAIDCGSPGCF